MLSTWLVVCCCHVFSCLLSVPYYLVTQSLFQLLHLCFPRYPRLSPYLASWCLLSCADPLFYVVCVSCLPVLWFTACLPAWLFDIRQGDGKIEYYARHFLGVTRRSAMEKTCLMVIFWGGLAEPFKSRMSYWVPEESLEDYINLALNLSGSTFRVELTAEPAPFREPTESAPEPTPFREPTESAPEPTPFREPTESAPEPTPFREPTESAPEPTQFREPTESAPEPAPFREPTESAPEPAQFREPTESAPEPAPFREPTESAPEPAPFCESTGSAPEPAPIREPTESAPFREPTESAPEPSPVREPTESTHETAPLKWWLSAPPWWPPALPAPPWHPCLPIPPGPLSLHGPGPPSLPQMGGGGVVSRSCWCALTGPQMSLYVEHMACCWCHVLSCLLSSLVVLCNVYFMFVCSVIHCLPACFSPSGWFLFIFVVFFY